MAHQARRPMLCAFLYPPRCLRQGRSFSRGSVSRAVGQRVAMPQNRQRPQKSMRVASQEAAGSGMMSNDLGFLMGSFVMPTGSNKPSLFHLPKVRLKLEWHRLKQRVQDLGGVLYYKYGITNKPNPRPKLSLGNTGRLATALHSQMYTAFAEGDAATLSKICTEGLLASFRSRIASRVPGERLRWILCKYTRRPRVVSHRAVMIPLGKGIALRQAVVRIQSRQSLARLKPNGELIEGTGEEKDVREYVVVQRRMMKEKEEPWMVWGTVEESDWKLVVADR